jgi:vancomycin resistance protein YoaR
MKKACLTILIFILLAFLSVKSVFAAGGDFTFIYNGQTFNVSSDTITSWQAQQSIAPNPALVSPPVDFQNYLRNFLGQNPDKSVAAQTYNYNFGAIYNYVLNLSNQINVKSREPQLTIQNNRASAFVPPQTGLEVDVYKSSLDAVNALQADKASSALMVYQTPPQNSLAQTNSLGINQLIAEGVSGFAGSPSNRRHNIAVGVTKFQGLLIPQGAEFSFDDNLGPVTAEAGFLPELVIKGSQGTIPELGGGLCQVSTTTFRAAMAAGLPITDRRNHAYAVQYYSPQGTDATIYPGSADLKFINNTPGTILIWPYEKDSNTLVFDFYGTNDGRKVTLEKPVVYDRQPDQSMKATWTRLVTKDGVTSTSTFNSVYQSPALFHKTETFVSATGTPITGLKIPAAKTQ